MPEEQFFYRAYQLDRGLVDEKTRSVPVTFSSENPVKRWFGNEVLLHGEKNVDLKRLRSIGAGLLNHNPNTIVGPLSDARIEERQGRCTLGFDDDEDGNRAMGKVKSGSLRGISVGYRITKFREILRDEEWTDDESGQTFRGPAMIATRWEPVEVSLTPVPADANSKVGRELARSLDGIEIERTTHNKGARKMERNEVQEMIDATVRGLKIPTVDDLVSGVRDALREDQKPKLSMPVERALELRTRAGAVSPDCQNKISGMILDGKSEVECEREISTTLLGRSDGGGNPSGDGGNFTGGQRGGVDFEKMDDDSFAENLRNLDDVSGD